MWNMMDDREDGFDFWGPGGFEYWCRQHDIRNAAVRRYGGPSAERRLLLTGCKAPCGREAYYFDAEDVWCADVSCEICE